MGALNATARPAPPNAVCIILTSESGSRARLAASAPIAAPMCTVGPSRPSTSPDPMLNTPPTNFAGTSRMSGGRASPEKDRFDMLDAAAGGQRLPPHDQGGQGGACRGGGHRDQPAGPRQRVRPVDEVDAQVDRLFADTSETRRRRSR